MFMVYGLWFFVFNYKPKTKNDKLKIWIEENL